MYEDFVYKTLRVFYDPKFHGADLYVTGFKGFGAVGYITTLHLVEKLGCKRIGFIVTKYLPEETTLDAGGGIAGPFTLYGCKTGAISMIVQVNHDVPAAQERSRFAEGIVRFLKAIGVKEAVFFGGFDSRFRSGEEKLRWVKTSTYPRSLEAPLMDKGLYVIGPLALMLLFSEIHSFPAAALLPYAEASRPDPRAAAVAVETLATLYGFEVSVEDLLEEARKIEEMIMALERQQEAASMPPSSERVYM